MNDPELDRLLKADALDEAEKMTGKSYKDDDATAALGMFMQMHNSNAKTAALEERGDTTFRNKVDRYLEIVQGIGFKIGLKLPYAGRGWKNEPITEHLFILYRLDGLLLVFDTFQTDGVNGGHLYYNLKVPKANGWPRGILSSYQCYKEDAEAYYITGYHDAREALVYNIRNMEAVGQFLPKWEKAPFLWLLHYSDTYEKDSVLWAKPGGKPSYDSDAINTERIAMLPKEVQEMING